jgi:hypothetical protein
VKNKKEDESRCKKEGEKGGGEQETKNKKEEESKSKKEGGGY